MTDSSRTATIADGPVGPRLTKEAVDHAASRGLSTATLVRLGVASGMAFFPALERKSQALYFPYGLGRYKAVAFPDKAFKAKGENPPFFNLENVIKAPPGDVFITEGEIDAASLVESGIPVEAVLSVPSGASFLSATGEPPDTDRRQRAPQRFPYVEEAMRLGLGHHKRFIWCGDMDDVGLALRQKMARMLGVGNFWFVDWPEGIKDANDMLVKEGAAAVLDLVVYGAKRWPVEGLYKLKDMPEPAPLVVWDTGFRSWEKKIHLADRTLSVVTGQPGSGKTLMTAQIWFQVLKRYDIVMTVATFETRAKPEYRRIIRTLHSGKLERHMSGPEIAAADEFIDAHYCFIEHPDRQPDLRWFLDIAEASIVREGAKIIQIDPWNRMESVRGRDEREDEYISRCLKAVHGFAQDMNVHFQIIAHPAKMDGTRKGHEPILEDIAGAKHWDNIPDQGLVIHRPTRFDPVSGVLNTEATITHAKARFPVLGYDCRMKLIFDMLTGRYLDGVIA